MLESNESLLPAVHEVLKAVADLEHRTYLAADLPGQWSKINQQLAHAELSLHRWNDGTVGGNSNPLAGNLCTLIANVAQLRHQIAMNELAQRSEMLHKAELGLQCLGAAESEAEFIEMLPHEVVKLGYIRAIYSTVDRMRWVTQSAFTLNGESERDQLLRAGQQAPFRDVRKLYEYEMVRDRKAILQHNVRKSPRVHPELIRVTDSESYVAAPLMRGQMVSGFVSLDINAESGEVRQSDREVVSLFCVGAGIALERVRMLDSLVGVHAGLEAGLASLRDVMSGQRPRLYPVDSLEEVEVEGGLGGELLTRREGQVLKLLAKGRSNSEISERLYISEGTAKTHVRNILRKLGVSNRTQAAQMYFNQVSG